MDDDERWQGDDYWAMREPDPEDDGRYLVDSSPTLRVWLIPDTPECPRDDACYVGSICRLQGPRWLSGEDADIARRLDEGWQKPYWGIETVMRYLRIFHGANVVLPLALDATGCRVQSEFITAVIFDTPDRVATTGVAIERIPEILAGEVRELDQWLAGDCWGYRIEEYKPLGNSGRAYWHEVDSCWGFVGRAYAVQEAMAAYLDHQTAA